MKKNIIKLIIITTVLFFSINLNKLYSQTIYVKSTAIGLNDGSSWNDAFTDLQSALAIATAGDIIWVAQGTYKPGASQNDEFRPIDGVEIYGGFPAVGSPNFGDRNYILYETILSGDIDNDNVLDAENTYHVIWSNSGLITNSAIFDGFTISGGYADTENDGGGIYLQNASPTIRNCKITNNNADDNGGGVYLTASNAIIQNCIIENNYTADNGGGICFYSLSNAQISDCVINLNTNNEVGAGIYINGSNPTFTNVDITNNSILELVALRDGAGVYLTNNSSPAFVGGSISGNSVPLDDAGAVYIANGSASFTNVSFVSNTAFDYGGAIYIDNGTPIFSNCMFDSNSTTGPDNGGGAIYIRGVANPSITNCTFNQNSSTLDGGAIYASSTAWTNPLDGNVFTNNSVTGANANNRGRGGAVYIQGSSVDVINNSFSNNTASGTDLSLRCGQGGALYLSGTANYVYNNIFENNTANATSTGADNGRGGAISLINSAATIVENSFNNNIAYFGGAIAIVSNVAGLSIENCTFNGNTANSYIENSGFGGALYLNGGAAFNIITSTFTNNSANIGAFTNAGFGGNAYFTGGVDAVFNRCSVSGNSASFGGAFYTNGTNEYKIINTLITSNTAQDGGAFYFFNSSPSGYNYYNNTIVNNNATGNGGSVFCQNSDPRFVNTIFWGNTAVSGNEFFLNDTGSDPFISFCDVQGGSVNFAGTGSGASYSMARYFNNIEDDPLFSDAQFHLSQSVSPCISSGNPASVVGDFLSDEDFDGEKRIRGIIDIGAFETNNPPQFVDASALPAIVDLPGPISITIDEDNFPIAFNLELGISEADDDELVWTIITNPANGTIDALTNTISPYPTTKTINYTPNANYSGADVFQLQISDGVFTDNIAVNVTINPINDAPLFVSTPTTSIKSFKTWTYNIVTSDVDHLNSDLTVTCLSKPAGMSFIGGANGVASLSWTPDEADVGIYNVVLQVDDTGIPIENSQQIFSFEVISRVIYVPADQPTIQLGIDAATEEDIVMVADGIYPEIIDFKGKNIEVRGNIADPSQVTINGNNLGSVVTFSSGEPSTATLQGFTITGGKGTFKDLSGAYNGEGYFGGGIFINNSFPTLKNLIIANNIAEATAKVGGSGAGIFICNGSSVTIEDTDIYNNTAEYYRGGGICVNNSSLNITNSNIYNNEGGNYGGALSAWNSILTLDNTSLTGNSASGVNGHGGGIFLNVSTINLSNVTINGNSALKSGNGVYDYGSNYNGTYIGGDDRIDIE